MPTADLAREYFNLRSYLQVEYIRALFPPLLYLLAFAVTGWALDGVPRADWYEAMMPYLTAVIAFTCAGGAVYFGGRAWRGTRLAIAMHRELQTRSDRQFY